MFALGGRAGGQSLQVCPLQSGRPSQVLLFSSLPYRNLQLERMLWRVAYLWSRLAVKANSLSPVSLPMRELAQLACQRLTNERVEARAREIIPLREKKK